MSVTLGEGLWQPPPSEPPRSRDEERHEELLRALLALRADLVMALAAAGEVRPEVRVDAPDLTPLGDVVLGVAAVRDLLAAQRPPAPVDLSPLIEAQAKQTDVLAKLVDKIERLGKQVAAAGSAGTVVSSGRSVLEGGVLDSIKQPVDVNLPARTLAERMFAKAPVAGYSLWLDTADPTYIYIAEAPLAAVGTDPSFTGIRVVKDASGNPLGKVQQASGFTWDTRGAATWL